MSSYAYIKSNMLAVCPLLPKDVENFKIKITSERGETRWMNITSEQFSAIETVLFGDLKEESK